MLPTVLVALACAPAPPEGRHVAVEAEEALIVWDEAAKRQHFIRRASFDTDAKDFGFLVPTPSRPELAEVGAELFDQLREATRPRVIEQTRFAPTLSLFLLARPKAAGPLRSAVNVLEIARVAGYEAAVLEADDAEALAAWLKEHGYAHSPSLVDWLKPYVEKSWKVTAFRVVERATAAVRMSFDTETPFFPYREPADQRTGPSALRSLRVYFVGAWKAQVALGSGPAPLTTYWAQPFSGKLPVAAPAGAWLTVFLDPSTPRPGVEELFFSKAPDGAAVMPEVHELAEIPLPLDCLCVVAGIGGLVVWAVRRRKQPAPQPR